MTKRIQISSVVASLLFAFVSVPTSLAQSTDSQHSDQSQHQQGGQQDLHQQIQDMQTKIAKLESALKQQHSAKSNPTSSHESGSKMQGMKKMKEGKKVDGMGMGSMGGSGTKSGSAKMSGMKMGGMSGGMTGDKGGMGTKKGMSGMSGDGKGMPGMGMKMMGRGMMMMGKMKSMGEMNTPSSLPGFPGASHIYHIGADGFFLNHDEHITLTTTQQATLNKLKEEAALRQADTDRKVEAAEQELWVLTASDSPDAKKIEDKISEVAKLQEQQRIDYIRAIGTAAKSLSEEQRNILTGTIQTLGSEK